MSNAENVQFRVIDIPMGSTAEDCERLLNAVAIDDFYPGAMVHGEETGARGIAHRVFFKRGSKNVKNLES